MLSFLDMVIVKYFLGDEDCDCASQCDEWDYDCIEDCAQECENGF